MSTAYDLVLFDMDGTLLDSQNAHEKMFRRYWAKSALSEGRKEPEWTAGPTLWDVFSPSGITRRQMREVYEELERFYRNDARDIIERLLFVPDAQKAVLALHREGVRTALVSNSHEALVREITAQNGAQGWFDAVSGSTYAQEDKPERLCSTAQALGVPLDRALYVGDNESDARTAHRIGMDSCIVLSPISWVKSVEDLMCNVRPGYVTYTLENVYRIAI